jgi:hypothetical protein
MAMPISAIICTGSGDGTIWSNCIGPLLVWTMDTGNKDSKSRLFRSNHDVMV